MALRLDIYPRSQERAGEVLVVLIHGLAEPDQTWVCAETTWKDLLLSDPQLGGVDVGVVKYDTALIGSGLLSKFSNRLFGKTVGKGNFTRIETLSRELRREFEAQDLGTTYRHVVLVGHSMGGLVGIRYLLEEIEHEMPVNVRGYISLATPFNGSLIAVGQHVLGRFMPHNQIEQLLPNSEFQAATRRLWKELKEQNKLESIHFTFCFGTQDTIVRENDATPYVVEKQWTEVVPLPGDHSGVIEVSDHRSASYRQVQKLIRTVMQTPPPTPDGGGTPTERTEGSSASTSLVNGLNSTDAPLALATMPAVLPGLIEHLQRHGSKLERDITRYPEDAQSELSQSMLDVFAKLTTMDGAELRAFLQKYRYPFATEHEETHGLRELWELLTLIQYGYPEWRFQPTDICNLFLEQGRWSQLIYSAHEQPMLEIVLELADEIQRGPYGALLGSGDKTMFPHRLVLENARSTVDENVCEHCGQPYPFRNLLVDCTEAEFTGMFELEVNSYQALEGVKISCGDCIRHSRSGAQNADEVRKKIRRVI